MLLLLIFKMFSFVQLRRSQGRNSVAKQLRRLQRFNEVEVFEFRRHAHYLIADELSAVLTGT